MSNKKIFLSVITFLLLFITACTDLNNNNNNGNNNNEITDEIAPIINGTKTIYYQIGNPVPNYLEGVSAFDETDGNVTSSMIIDSRLVNLSVEGEYVITYYAFDNSGNIASKDALINVSAEDLPDLTPPNYPDRDFITLADSVTNISLGDDDALLTANPPLFEVVYNESAAQDLSWQTHYTINLSSLDYSRKTHLGLNVLGSGPAIYVKLLAPGDEVVVEREVIATSIWKESVIQIPDTKRYLLSGPLKLQINIPKPSALNESGVVKISGIWFEGDDEPAIKVEYDPLLFHTVYEVDLSKMDNTYDHYDDLGNGPEGLINATYQSDTNSVLFVNSGFNDWASLAYQIPDKDGEGDLIALNSVKYVVIELRVSEGAIVKAQEDWNSGNTFEYDGLDNDEVHYWILPIGPSGYQAFGAVTFSPSYLREGISSSEVELLSIKLVRPIE